MSIMPEFLDSILPPQIFDPKPEKIQVRVNGRDDFDFPINVRGFIYDIPSELADQKKFAHEAAKIVENTLLHIMSAKANN